MSFKRFTSMAMTLLSFSAVQAQNVQTNNQGVIVNQVIVPVYSTRPSEIEILDKYLVNRNSNHSAYEAPVVSTAVSPNSISESDAFFNKLGYRKTRTAIILWAQPSIKSASLLLMPPNATVEVSPLCASEKETSPQMQWAFLKFYDPQARAYQESYAQWKFLKAFTSR